MHVIFDELIEYSNGLPGDIGKAVSDVSFFVYAVHPGLRVPTVLDLLNKYPVADLHSFETGDETVTVLLGVDKAPDLLVVEGKDEHAGVAEMTRKFGCRIYSIGFDVRGLDTVVDTLRTRGVEFITESPVNFSGTRFISTTQSAHTGDTFWYVERKRGSKEYLFFQNASPVELEKEVADAFKKHARLKTFNYMEGFDHVLYRVSHEHFMAAAMEVLASTPYTTLDITDLDENDARLMSFRRGKKQPVLAMLCARNEHGAPEEYVRAHGPRIQHVSWAVSDVAKVYTLQKKRGIVFASEAVQGSEEDGIRQVYTTPSPCTGDVTEYVERSGSEHCLFPKHSVSGLFQDMPFA
jgi:hypothetical protein